MMFFNNTVLKLLRTLNGRIFEASSVLVVKATSIKKQLSLVRTL